MVGILDKYELTIEKTETLKLNGKVKRVVGLTVEGTGPPANLGELCHILIPGRTPAEDRKVEAEVVGIKEDGIILMPYYDISGISAGCPIVGTGRTIEIPVGKSLLGRIIDGRGQPLDDKGPVEPETYYSIFRTPPPAIKRKRIKEKISTGVKAIDGLLTTGAGQRVGIFSGSGVGKTTLLGMISRFTDADVNVIALIGERGREVNEFLEKDLGEEGLKKR